MMRTVSLRGKDWTVVKILEASPSRNEHFPEGRLFNSALRLAALMDSVESSIPAIVWKYGERVMAKRPLPQYASTRCVGLRLEEAEPEGSDGVDDEGGKIASRT